MENAVDTYYQIEVLNPNNSKWDNLEVHRDIIEARKNISKYPIPRRIVKVVELITVVDEELEKKITEDEARDLIYKAVFLMGADGKSYTPCNRSYESFGVPYSPIQATLYTYEDAYIKGDYIYFKRWHDNQDVQGFKILAPVKLND